MPSRLIIRPVKRNTPTNAAGASPLARGAQTALDGPFHAPARAQHLHSQGSHRDRRNEGERPLEPFLVRRAIEEVPADGADGEGGDDAPVNRANQLRPSRLPEISKADRDNQEGFDPFPQGDDKGLEHDGSASKMRLSLRMWV